MPSSLSGLTWFPLKGVNLSCPPHPIPSDAGAEFASDGYDFLVEYGTDLKKRDGYDNVNASAASAAGDFIGLGSLYHSDGRKYELIFTDEGRVWQDVSGTIVVSAQVFAAGTFGVAQPLSMTQFLDTLICMDGVASARTWTGTATSAMVSGTITACPIAKYGEVHLNKFFVTGIAGSLSLVSYSTTGSYAVYAGVGTDDFNVSQNDGDINKGLKSFSWNELLIFKERSTWQLLGDSSTNFMLNSLDKAVGCVCNRGIQNYKGGLMIWPARDGLYVYDGAKVQKISEAIDSLWNEINFTRFEWMDSMVDEVRGLYLLAIPKLAAVHNAQIIVVDLNHPWQDENGIHFPIFVWRVSAESLRKEITSANIQKLVFGGVDGWKYKLSQDYKSDNGASIESFIVTPLFTFEGSIGNENCLRRIYLPMVSTSGSIKIYSEIKDSAGWVLQETLTSGAAGAAFGVDFTINVTPFGATEISTTARANIQARSRRIKTRFLQDSATEYYTIQAPIEFYFKLGGQRS